MPANGFAPIDAGAHSIVSVLGRWDTPSGSTFCTFSLFKGKVRKPAKKKGGGPMMDFLTLGPTGVHVLEFVG